MFQRLRATAPQTYDQIVVSRHVFGVAKTAGSGRVQILCHFLNSPFFRSNTFGLRQARARFGPFSDRPERGPRDDRNGGPGRESRETIRVSKSMMMSTMTSTMRMMTMMMPTSSRSRQKIRGVQRSNSEFLNRPLDTNKFRVS